MNSLTAALLAGGASTRMGRDKCLLEVGGEPLWRRQWNLLREIADEVFVVSPERPTWSPPDAAWLADVATNCGPLAGLATVLRGAAHSRVLLLAIDLPGMTSTYLNTLAKHATQDSGVVPEVDGLFQPLSAIYPRAALATVLAHLAQPDKSFQHLLRKLITSGLMRALAVSTENRPLFRNLNTPED